MASDRKQIVLHQDIVDLIAGNPGLTLNRAQLNDILVQKTQFYSGCIRQLRFESDDVVSNLWLDTATGGEDFGPSRVSNLSAFSQTLLAAVNHGHKISFCVTANKKMVMLNLHPCGCPCPKD